MKLNSWGDNVTLIAACALFNLKIKVISSTNYIYTVKCPKNWNVDTNHKIYIIHIFECHYNSTIRKR